MATVGGRGFFRATTVPTVILLIRSGPLGIQVRGWDCKVPSCREALTESPSILDSLCDDCRTDFDLVMDSLSKLDVPYVVDKRLVRGLDYYTRTAFEIQTTSLGAQSAVAGGGRYDNLVKELGGPDIPATGFAIGFDRLAELVGLNAPDLAKKPEIFLAAAAQLARAITMIKLSPRRTGLPRLPDVVPGFQSI